MQTNDVELVVAEYEGLVATPVATLIELVKAGHLEAASLIADRSLSQLSLFATRLRDFAAKALPPLPPEEKALEVAPSPPEEKKE
jgi:hypothetical protein